MNSALDNTYELFEELQNELDRDNLENICDLIAHCELDNRILNDYALLVYDNDDGTFTETPYMTVYENFLQDIRRANEFVKDEFDDSMIFLVLSCFIENGAQARPKFCNKIKQYCTEYKRVLIERKKQLEREVIENEKIMNAVQASCTASAGKVIAGNSIMKKYIYSPGGPLERAWHPSTGSALKRYGEELYPDTKYRRFD